MNKSLLTILFFFLSLGIFAQVAFQEDFESVQLSVTSTTTGAGGWGLNTRVQSQGLKSDSCTVSATDTVFLTTNSFSTVGKYNVILEFDQICEIEYYDRAFVQYSTDGGLTYNNATLASYTGSGIMYLYNGNNYGFTGLSYPGWNFTDSIVTNSMWKSESFDLSDSISNQANVKIRFMLVDGAFSTAGNNGFSGWFLDSIKVTATVSEIIPPNVSLISPIKQGAIISSDPISIGAIATDDSNIDTVLCIINVMPDNIDTVIGMSLDPNATDSFYCNIPFFGFGHTVSYYVKAIDSSYSHNTDSTLTYSYQSNPFLGEHVTIGTASNTGYPLPMDMYFGYTYSQTIYKSSYFNGSFGNISKISYHYNGYSAHTDSVKIYMGQTGGDGFASTSSWVSLSNLTLVYDGPFTTTTTAGWIEIDLITPYSYDGSSNLVVAFDENTAAYHLSGDDFYCSKLDTKYSSIYYRKDIINPDPTNPPIASGRSQYIPNTKFYLEPNLPATLNVGVNNIVNPNSSVIAGIALNTEVTLKNYALDTITTAIINWKYDGNTQNSYLFSGALLPDSTSTTLNIGTLTPTVGYHNLKIWSENPNGSPDNDLSNDMATINFYACSGPLSGTYTIGGIGADFANLHEANIGLNECGISGAVIFEIADGTYPEQLELTNISGISATNTISFKSNSGDSTQVIIEYNATDANDNYVIKLDSASHITFKGITFKALDSSYSRVIVVNNYSHDNKFESNIFKGINTGSSNNLSLVYSDNSSSDSNNTFIYNKFIDGYYGIDWSGVSTSTLEKGLLIEKCIFENQNKSSINLTKVDAVVIKANTIIDTLAASMGIYLDHVKNKWTITENNIQLTNGGAGIAIWYCNSKLGQEALIANNMISIGGSSNNHLIDFANGTNINFFNNSFNNYSTGTGEALYINKYPYSSQSDSIHILNNNLINSGGGIAIKIASGITVELNYNNYLSNGKIGKYGNTEAADIAAWKVLTQQDTNSVSLNPFFASQNNLHVNNNLFNGLGKVLSDVTIDIDGDMRDASNPDIGADEFDPSPFDIAAIGITAPLNGCGMSNETVKVNFKNIGNDTINGSFVAKYQLLGSSTIVSENVTSTIAPMDTLEYVFNTLANFDVSSLGGDSIFIITAWGELTNDNFHINDTTSANIESGFSPAAPTVSNVNTNYATSTTLHASGNSVFFWETDTSSSYLVNDSDYTTPILYDTTTYWVSNKLGAGNQSVQCGNGTVTSSYVPNYGYFDYSWSRLLYTASEIGTSGTISSISFFVKNSPSYYSMNNQKIYFELSNNTSITSSNYIAPTSMTKVFDGNLTYNGSGIYTINLNTPFNYDGTSSLIVQWENYDGSWVSGYPTYEGTSINNMAVYDRADNSFPTGSGTILSKRPNIELSISSLGKCYSAKVPITANVIGFPSEDAGISAIISPSSNVIGDSLQTIKVELSNYGANALTSVDIIWMKTGSVPDTFSYTGNIAYQHKDTVTLGTTTFDFGSQAVMAWTSMPNNIIDTITSNDTSYFGFTACLTGTYTIGTTTGGNSFDFPNFNSAILALHDGGVCGDVTFLINEDIYNERFSIQSIPGIGPNARVKFTSANGDSINTKLHYTTSSNAAWMIKVNSPYISFDKLSLSVNGGTSFGRVIELATNANNIRLTNCIITGVNTNSTSNNYSVIYGDNNSHNNILIENNEIIYGSDAIRIGSYSTSNQSGITIHNNNIHDFNYYGISLQKYDTLIISNNNISSNTTNSSSVYGININTSKDITINKNRIRMYPAGSTATGYGINISGNKAVNGKSGLISNNYIYFGNGSYTNNSIYLYNTEYLDIYYNTIHNSYGDTKNRAIYVYSSSWGYSYTNVNIKNNIIRDSLGYVAYISTPGNIDIMDNNIYYTEATNFAYWDYINKANLTALQIASSKDVNSQQTEPNFLYSDSVMLESSALSIYGLAVPEVTDDIFGKTRSLTSTTPGAHENPIVAVDLGLLSIVDVPNNTNEAQIIPIKAKVKNFGTDTLFSFGIEYQINGGAIVDTTINYTLLPSAISTFILTPFQSPAGNSHICVRIVLAADSNIYNNEKCKPFFGNPTKDAQVIQINNIASRCNMMLDTVRIWVKNLGVDTINGSNGQMPTLNYKSNTSATITENFTTIVATGDSILFTFATLVDLATNNYNDSTYNISAWIEWANDNVGYNDTAYLTIVSPHTPLVPTFVSPVLIPYGTSAVLSATASDTIYWYDDDTSYYFTNQGNTYNTPSMYSEDTVWLASSTGNGIGFTNIGTGIISPSIIKITEIVQYKSGTGSTNPYPTYFPSDFDGIEITNMGNSIVNLTGWTVHFRGTLTADYTFPSGTVIDVGELLTCISYSGAIIGPVGNNVYAISTISNLYSGDDEGYIIKDNNGTVVDAVSTNGYNFLTSDGVTAADWSGSISGLSNHAGAVRIVSDNNTPSDWGITGTETASFGSLNTQLNISTSTSPTGCSSARVPLIMQISGLLASDVGVSTIVSPQTGFNLSNEPVKIRVKCYGTSAQSNIPVAYSLDGATPILDTITATINPGDSLDFTFSTLVNLSIVGINYELVSYTTLVSDSNKNNDTINSIIVNQLPTYCISEATDPADSRIDKVEIGTISNNTTSTGCAQYSDFTNISTTLGKGGNYTISVTLGTCSSGNYNKGAKAWIDYNCDGDFDDAGEEIANFGQGIATTTYTKTISIPVTANVGLTRMRIVGREGPGTNNTSILPCGTYTYGETEDYSVMILSQIANDAGVEAINGISNYSTSNIQSLDVKIRNFGSNTLSSFSIAYKINGGNPVITAYSGAPLLSGNFININLGNITLSQGNSNICVYTILSGDTNTFNDEMCVSTYLESTAVLSYTDDFESNDLWFNDTLINQWELGTPNSTTINSAHSGSKAWAINLDGNYDNNSNDRLYSPKFIFPSVVDSAVLKFWHYVDCEPSDGGYLQFKDGVNKPWSFVGYVGDTAGTNWLNKSNGGIAMWSFNNSGWMQSEYKIRFNDVFNTFYQKGDTIQFRFVFYSDGSNNTGDGWAIDDFEIILPVVSNDAGIMAITTPSDSAQTGSSKTVKIEVKNYGTNTLTSIPVSYSVNGGTPITATFTPSGSGLAAGATEQYTFTTPFIVPGNNFTLCAKTSLGGDVYPQNNEICNIITVTPANINIGIVEVLANPAWSDTTKQSFNTSCTIKIINRGLTTITSIPLQLKLGSNTMATETWTGSIALGDTAVFTFATTYHSPVGNYQLCAISSLANDADNADDNICKSYVGVSDVGINNTNGFDFTVSQNKPNPAYGNVSIDFVIPKAGDVRFELRNPLGQIIISNENSYNLGKNTLVVNANSLSNGVYYYTVEFDHNRITRKMIVNQ